ncbi:MAG: adenosyl-hopene transferase HpnH [Chloroflexi bacterium]|nr:adenosyl-hopene transferase HpnH [Chloroflexota bacterium]
MGFPRQLTTSLAGYVMENSLRGRKQFPLVLMLEPSLKCNLACAGCGRIREFKDILDRSLSVEECLAAVDEAGAPVVSITGGEPLLHPGIDHIVSGIVSRGKFVHLCTNGLLLERSLGKFKPGPRMAFVLHLDSLAEPPDRFAGREGVFETAISAIRSAKRSGFRVLINTTFYKQTRIADLEQLFSMLAAVPVDGMMVAPAFSYEAVDSDVFLSREEMVESFRPIYQMPKKLPFYNTPLYLDFLAGKRELSCVPWSTPTRNPKGWKRPCYLVTDGHCASFRELMEETDWSKYGVGNDKRCRNCMVHCGFEGGAMAQVGRSLPDLWRTVKWSITG